MQLEELSFLSLDIFRHHVGNWTERLAMKISPLAQQHVFGIPGLFSQITHVTFRNLFFHSTHPKSWLLNLLDLEDDP